METRYNLLHTYLAILCCPKCKSSLTTENDLLLCQNGACKSSYPIMDGKPVLIHENNSLFSISDYVKILNKKSEARRKTKISIFFRKIKSILLLLVPKLSANLSDRRIIQQLIDILFSNTNSPTVLVIGSGTHPRTRGMKKLYKTSSINLIKTDVSPTSDADIFCDAHDNPFKDETIDGVIIQAVLEHVIDPKRCIQEIHRVLKKTGIVYSSIPFMQQVHSGRYDFTRFTHLGHRSLFRNFDEIESGLVAGPGTSLAWAYRYFLRSFVKSDFAAKLMFLFARLTGFWLKYFDYILKNTPGALDAASCTYFFGMKSSKCLPDKSLIAQYRGRGYP